MVKTEMDKIERYLTGKKFIAKYSDGSDKYEYHFEVCKINTFEIILRMYKIRYTTSWGEWRENDKFIMCDNYKFTIRSMFLRMLKLYFNVDCYDPSARFSRRRGMRKIIIQGGN